MANRSSVWRANCWGRHEEALCERAGGHGPAHPELAGCVCGSAGERGREGGKSERSTVVSD
eukprot:1187178-Prymnesium_polylepis.1